MIAIFSSLAGNFGFAMSMSLRDLKGLNKGAALGLGWLIVKPVVQLAAYVAIVTLLFSSKSTDRQSVFGYTLYVLSGMVSWILIQRVFEDSTSLIRDRMDIVKQMIYPIETLPVTSFVSSSISPLVALVLFISLTAFTGQLSPTILLLPLPLAMLFATSLGASWLLMVAGVVFKDLREIVSVVFGLMAYFSPMLLRPEMTGPRLWDVILLNPLAHIVICFRDVLVGEFHPRSWVTFSVLASLLLVLGAWTINKTKVKINEYL